jgi:hypothetical protein
MSDRLALANEIEEAGIERSKAERVASVIVATIYDRAATKADVLASETAVRADVAQLSATTRADLATLEAISTAPGLPSRPRRWLCGVKSRRSLRSLPAWTTGLSDWTPKCIR